jgi:hypothetical protein
MLECPSCQQTLPPAARFCTRCGVRLSATLTISPAAIHDPLLSLVTSRPAQPFVDDISAYETLSQKVPAGTSRQTWPINDQREPEKTAQPSPVEALSAPDNLVDPYAQEKRELAAQCATITASMESLLPFVYENHRSENQALFASTLEPDLPLEDPIWGRVAFVLGAYGNYMYRYPLDAEQKRQVWNALLWAVFYERCYRRKYLVQRFQQLLHFFQGCAEDATFRVYTLDDLERLSSYLEATSLKKLLEALQQLSLPPASILQRVSEQLTQAQEAKQEQQATLAEQQGKMLAPMKKEQPTHASQRPPDKDTSRHPENAPVPLNQVGKRQGSGTPGQRKAPAEAIVPAARTILGFFTDEQIQEFFASLRAAGLETINRLLRNARQPLLMALLQELTTPDASEYQAPRRPIRLGKKHVDRFPEASCMLNSSRASEQQIGLRMFEQGARETTHPDYASLAREWMLYARALVQGSPRVVDDWESDFQHNEASWEEIWNLASFYQQTGYPAESLRVLKPGLDEWRAPVAHLQLALACALRSLLEPGRCEPAAQKSAYAFLLAHLEQWLHPLSYLAWLLLAHETHGPLHPLQQSQRLSTFQELIEHPLNMPDPQKDLQESRVTALEEALVEKARCEEAWFLWINDYAERHQRKYQAWARLAETSERLGRLKSAELALQHLVEIQYQHDYARYQEGTPPPRADYLRRNLEKLFEFYQRHNLMQASEEAFHSCYPSLSHLWDLHEPANRRLLALTRLHLETRLQQDVLAPSALRETTTRDLSKTITLPLEHFTPGQRVGIFLDYENIARFIPRDIDAEEVGNALNSYATQFGEVVCRWASASPQNLSNLADVRTGLEAACFKVRFPRRELQFSASKKNLADFALLECLSDAHASEQPDIYLIVSGDRDYYERVWSLLDAGHTVRVIAAADSQHLSLKYRELEQQRARERQATGYKESDFFIDNLEEILCPLVPLN